MSNPMRITRVLIIAFTCLVIGSLVLALMMMRADNTIALMEERRYNSFLLADELRQSSDDLTHMVRAYTSTGEGRYNEYFERILDIRNGKVPRPKDYHLMYWDFVLAEGEFPDEAEAGEADGNEADQQGPGELKSLSDRMVDEGFTDEELDLMDNSASASHSLANTIEYEARKAVEGWYKDKFGDYTIRDEPSYETASGLLYGKKYHQDKKLVMEPLKKFFEMIDTRTRAEVEKQRRLREMLELPLILTIAVSVLLGIVSLVRVGRFIEFLDRKEQDETDRLERERREEQRRAEREAEEERRRATLETEEEREAESN